MDLDCRKDNIAFVGLGSNQDNPTQQIKTAISNINHHLDIFILKTSSLLITKPYGYLDQDDFVNAVVKIKTSLNCYDLLLALQEIENKQHRKRTLRWGPRTLDLDILAFNQDIIDCEHLKVPHPDLYNRNFVLAPWSEIESAWLLPCGRSISELNEALTQKTPA